MSLWREFAPLARIRAAMERWLGEVWYGKHPAAVFLAPFALLFRAVVELRRSAYRHRVFESQRPAVPVIIVGNVTVGGTGKTPLVIWLAGYLRAMGYKPGVIARGYGGHASRWPQQVRPDADPRTVGDEAIVISRRTRCPVAVGPNRGDSARALLEHADCDILVSDDGLQHYGLERDIEIAVIDGVRRYGNGRCLPAGPLREPATRNKEVDIIVTNGIAGRGEFAMKYVLTHLVGVAQPDRATGFETFEGETVHGVAGIGNPERFFASLRSKGLKVIPHPFPDHHVFTREDLEFGDGLPVVMTEKDAVKCDLVAGPNCWMAPITAELPEIFASRIEAMLLRLKNGQKAA